MEQIITLKSFDAESNLQLSPTSLTAVGKRPSQKEDRLL